ncbi:hypothetical protein [Candidatus Acidianus copahuensis]|nr:hypothetical protein [Candidatus Acidianus copahuensis]
MKVIILENIIIFQDNLSLNLLSDDINESFIPLLLKIEINMNIIIPEK